MRPWLISLLFTLGAATWVYTKLQSRAGSENRQVWVVVAITGVIIFAVLWSVLSLIF